MLLKHQNVKILPMQVKDQKQKITITKDMNLGEVVNLYPEAAEVLLEYGLHCVGCFANTFDTIEMGSKVHGLYDDEIEEMLARINTAVNSAEVL